MALGVHVGDSTIKKTCRIVKIPHIDKIQAYPVFCLNRRTFQGLNEAHHLFLS